MEGNEVRKLKRTILIGLGGTGKKALLQAKKKFLETFGEEPPLVKFLLIDTTSANTDALKAQTPEGETRPVRLRASEVLHIEARGASLLPQVHDEIREWFPPKADLKANILSGAGQIRALGRLALFANAGPVYENLRDLLALARDYRDERPSPERRYIYEAYAPHVTVALVGSLAGGTGSGIFLDVAFVLRHLMKDEDQLFGYFLLPDIYANRPGTQNVEANAYAALMELDHFMSREDTWSYSFGGRTVPVRKKPFDMVFLVNRQNRAGRAFNEVEHLAELLGLGLYLLAGPLGKEQADVFDNIVHQLNEQKGRYHGKTAHYASFGAAELRFDPQGVAQEVRRKAIRERLRAWLEAGRPWEGHEIQKRLDEIPGLDLPEEEREGLPIGPSSSREEDQRVWGEFRPIVTTQAEKVKRRALQRWKEKGWPPDFWDELERAFSRATLPDLIQGLEEALRAAKTKEDELKKEHQKAKEAFEDQLDALGKQANPSRGWRIGAQEPPRLNRKALYSLWDQAWELGLAQAREEMAQQARRELEARLEDLKRLQQGLSEELRRLDQTPGQRAGSRDASPFLLTLPPPYLPDKGADLPDEPRSTPKVGLRDLARDPHGAVQGLLTGEGVGFKAWLSGVLRDKEAQRRLWEGVERSFRELDQVSSPAWDYQDAWVSNPGLNYREEVHILGLEDATDQDHPLVSDEELLSIFAGTLRDRMRLQRVSTGDPNRVLFYKVEASIPAFALRGVEIYREKYLTLRESRSFHIHRVWEKELPDLLPAPEKEAVQEIWTKARLLGLIQHREGSYRFRDRRLGEGIYRELGPSPARAYRTLEGDFFAFKELEAQVRSEEERYLRRAEALRELEGKVREALANRRSKLEDPNWSGEDREVFQKELEVLARWQAWLASYNPETGVDDFPSLTL